MAGKYVDFDAALSEAAEEPVVVRYHGRDWELFTSIPAKPVLQLLRLQGEGRSEGDLSMREMVDFMAQLVPAEVLESWLDLGMTIDELGALLRIILSAYGGGEAEEETSGEAPGPAEGLTASSSTSRP